jgi:RNA polymerase sigma factor (sigma-70 family)
MDTTSAADLFERYHLAAFRYFRRMTGRPDLAEDLTQELFLAIVRGLPGYQTRGREAGWVFKIAQNVLARHFRPQRREEAGAEDAADVATPAHQVLAIGVSEALRFLAVADRQVILLREVVGLGYAEIAETTGTTKDSVRARLFRARIKLRTRLGGRSRTTATSIVRDYE